MPAGEPARKKPKLAGEADKYQEQLKLHTILDSTRDPSNAANTSETSQGAHSSYDTAAATASDTKKFTVFVIDTDSRLFVAGQYSCSTALPAMCGALCFWYTQVQIHDEP